MAPRILILPTALENYRLAIRETARIWSPQQAKAYGRLLRKGFEEIPEAYARVRMKKDERVGHSLFRLHKIEHHYAAYIVVEDATFVVAAVLPVIAIADDRGARIGLVLHAVVHPR